MSDELKLGKNTQYQFDGPSIDILDTFENKHPDRNYLVPFVMPRSEFTSLCPVTNQPDQARIEILYIPRRKMVESKSLKLYLFSFRNHGAFHEDCINTIANDLFHLMHPLYLRVFGDFAPRGGIAIKPMVELRGSDVCDEDFQITIDPMVAMWDRKFGMGR